MSAGRFHRGGQPSISFFAFQDIITCVSGILVIITLLLSLHLDRLSSPSSDKEPHSPALIAQLDAKLNELTTEKNIIEKLQSAGIANDSAAIQADIAILQQQLVAARLRRDEQIAKAEVVDANHAGDAMAAEAETIRQQIRAIAEKVAKLEYQAEGGTFSISKWEQIVKDRETALLEEQKRRNQLWLIPEKSGTSKEAVLITVDGKSISLQRFGQSEAQHLTKDSEFANALKKYSKVDYYLVFYFKPSGAERFNNLIEAAHTADFEIGYDTVAESSQLNFGPPPTTSDK